MLVKGGLAVGDFVVRMVGMCYRARVKRSIVHFFGYGVEGLRTRSLGSMYNIRPAVTEIANAVLLFSQHSPTRLCCIAVRIRIVNSHGGGVLITACGTNGPCAPGIDLCRLFSRLWARLALLACACTYHSTRRQRLCSAPHTLSCRPFSSSTHSSCRAFSSQPALSRLCVADGEIS